MKIYIGIKIPEEDLKGRIIGKSTGLRFSLTRLSSALAPAVGGLIIVNYGFGTLFMASIVLLVVAALPITFAVHEWKHHDHDPIRVVKKYFFKERRYKLIFTYFGEGMEQTIYSIFWPLLLFFVLQNFVNIGFINSLSFLVSSVTVLLIGKLIDKHGTKKIHAIGSVANAIMYLPRMMFSNAVLFYGLDIFDRFNSSTYSLPIMSLSYDKGKKLGESDYILFREFSLHLGMISVVFLASAFILLFENWKWVFILGMVGSLLTYLIELDKS